MNTTDALSVYIAYSSYDSKFSRDRSKRNLLRCIVENYLFALSIVFMPFSAILPFSRWMSPKVKFRIRYDNSSSPSSRTLNLHVYS